MSCQALEINRPKNDDLIQGLLTINAAQTLATGQLEPMQAQFIRLLPLLFHDDHADLPDYDIKTPCGHCQLQPGIRTVENRANSLS